MRNAKTIHTLNRGRRGRDPPLRVNSILNLHTERVRPAYDAAGGPSTGYFNPSDPTLTYRNCTVSDSWTHGGPAIGALADTDAWVTGMFRVTSGDSGLADGALVDLN